MSQELVVKEGEGIDAFKLHRKIVSLKRKLEGGFLEWAAYLKLMRDSKLYVALGYQTWGAYLGSPEISAERTVVFRLIGIYEAFVQQLQVPAERLSLIARSKLEELLPHIGTAVTEESCEDWLHKAEALSVSDLKDEIADATGQVSKRLCGYFCHWCTLKQKGMQKAECLVCQERL